MVALPNHPPIGAIGMPHLATIKATTITTDYLANEYSRATQFLSNVFAPSNLFLRKFKDTQRNDSGMAILDEILRNLAFICFGFLGQEVYGKAFLQNGVSSVFLVFQYAHNGADAPRCLSAGREDSIIG